VKRGVEHRSIDSYSDLDGILGKGWHYRGLNDSGDFCYAIENTIDFYLHKKRRLMQYISTDDGTPSRVPIATGYVLVFKFIRGDGIGSQFGKLVNKNVLNTMLHDTRYSSDMVLYHIQCA